MAGLKKVFVSTREGRIVTTFPQGMAGSIGKTIMRYSYLEWLQSRIIQELLHINMHQGRNAIRLLPVKQFPGQVENLAALIGISIDVQPNKLARSLERAETARNTLAHSIFLHDPDNHKIRIQITRGTWELGGDAEKIKRQVHPETPFVDRAFLAKQRGHVEAAIKDLTALFYAVTAALRALSKIRATGILSNRRSRQ